MDARKKVAFFWWNDKSLVISTPDKVNEIAHLDFFTQHKLYQFGKCSPQLSNDIHHFALRLIPAHR